MRSDKTLGFAILVKIVFRIPFFGKKSYHVGVLSLSPVSSTLAVRHSGSGSPASDNDSMVFHGSRREAPSL